MKRSWLGLAVLALAIGVTGCGAGHSKVEGVVQYEDGTPVEGAMVVFAPAEGGGGGISPTGLTDAQGKFSLTTGTVEGAKKGKYKVLISRTPSEKLSGTDPSSPEAIALMKKNMTKGGKGGKGVMLPGEVTSPAESKNELDEKYSSSETTPYTEEVPTKGPVTYKVSKKKKKKKK